MSLPWNTAQASFTFVLSRSTENGCGHSVFDLPVALHHSELSLQ